MKAQKHLGIDNKYLLLNEDKHTLAISGFKANDGLWSPLQAASSLLPWDMINTHKQTHTLTDGALLSAAV